MTERGFGRVVVTGGAGFIGSHVRERLLDEGSAVVAVDNLCTGAGANIAHLMDRPAFEFSQQDVSLGLDVDGAVDTVSHCACPASPVDYLEMPLETLAVASRGTGHGLDLAQRSGGRLLLASTSEVYGDPAEHPQPETYWGNVNPIGLEAIDCSGARNGVHHQLVP